MHTPARPRSSSTRHSRAVAAFAGLLLLALSASACTVSSSDVSLGTSVGDTPAQSDNVQPQPENTDAATESASAPAPTNDDGYGPEPALQTFRISANAVRWSGNLVGVDYSYTEIDDRDQELQYIAVGGDTGIRASYLAQGANLMQVCVETADSCGGGDPSGASHWSTSLVGASFAKWAPYTFDDGPRIAGGILLGESVGWEVSDPNYTFDGRPGRCYRSLGSYQWQGDPEPTETAFPAGDIACVLYYETSSEYLVSYDFGGDGTLEIDTVRLADNYTESDIVHASYAPAQFDEAALLQLIETAGEEVDDFAILAQ